MPSTQLTSSTSFRDVPVEIKIMIWRFAIHAVPGRDIIIHHRPLPYIPLPIPDVLPQTEITSSTPIPAVLHACHLARLLAQEQWMLSLGAHEVAEKKVYVDVTTDSVHFPVQTLLMI